MSSKQTHSLLTQHMLFFFWSFIRGRSSSLSLKLWWASLFFPSVLVASVVIETWACSGKCWIESYLCELLIILVKVNYFWASLLFICKTVKTYIERVPSTCMRVNRHSINALRGDSVSSKMTESISRPPCFSPLIKGTDVFTEDIVLEDWSLLDHCLFLGHFHFQWLLTPLFPFPFWCHSLCAVIALRLHNLKLSPIHSPWRTCWLFEECFNLQRRWREEGNVWH